MLALRGLSKASLVTRRFINLQEYQSKNLLKQFNVSIQRGAVAETPEEAFKVAKNLKDDGSDLLVVKAQVLAGGRGKGTLSSGLQGGVKLSRDAAEVQNLAKQMIGYNLVTKQTTAEGEKVEKVLVCEAVNLACEKYFAFILDRAYGGPVAVCSTEGGVDIEEVAEKNPSAIKFVPVDVFDGITESKAEEIATALGFERGSKFHKMCMSEVRRLYKMFCDLDSTQLEVNPWVITDKDELICLDIKLAFDDNAAYRQQSIFKMGKEAAPQDELEARAEKAGVNYIRLDGNIGCLVNGAGLAMATMDALKLNGGDPANFLDVGGSASAAQVAEAFEIITSDSNVKTIFVNIFGGIMQCDTIAKGIVDASGVLPKDVRLVVRLRGTNEELGGKILKESGLKIDFFPDFTEAAKMAVQRSNEAAAVKKM